MRRVDKKSALERAQFTSAEYRAIAMAKVFKVGVEGDYLLFADALDELREAKAQIEGLEEAQEAIRLLYQLCQQLGFAGGAGFAGSPPSGVTVTVYGRDITSAIRAAHAARGEEGRNG